MKYININYGTLEFNTTDLKVSGDNSDIISMENFTETKSFELDKLYIKSPTGYVEFDINEFQEFLKTCMMFELLDSSVTDFYNWGIFKVKASGVEKTLMPATYTTDSIELTETNVHEIISILSENKSIELNLNNFRV